MVLAFGSAAAGSRLLWPVFAIAAYYAAGVLLTGTSPMVALLGETGSSLRSCSARPAGPGRDVGRQRRHDAGAFLAHALFPDAPAPPSRDRDPGVFLLV